MQNGERNPTQSQQKDLAARSPAKTPAAGAAAPDAATHAKEIGSTQSAGLAQPRNVRGTGKTPDDNPKPEARASDPVADASRRIRSVEVAGTAASGNTVDADGKTLEARRDTQGRRDNIITSNATLENHVAVQSDGLGGFDSRTVGAVPRIGTLPGYRVEIRGHVHVPDPNGGHTDVIVSLEPQSPQSPQSPISARENQGGKR